MKKKWPALTNDEEAERFVEEADLTEYDFSNMVPVRFEFEPKATQADISQADISQVAGAFGAMFHPVGALRNRNRQMADCGGGQVAPLTASVDLGIGESGIASEIQMLHDAPVTCNHRLQQRAPTVSAVDVAGP